MELLADVLRRRWSLILLPMVVVLLTLLPALPSTLNPPPRYSVAIRFTAAASSDVSRDSDYEDSAYVPWLASEYVVVNLPQWVTSDSFAQEVSALLAQEGMPIPFEDVRSAFVADSARSILVIYLNWDDEAEIRALATAAIEVLQTRNQTYFPQFAAHPATIQPIDEIRVNQVAVPLLDRFGFLFRVGIGLGAGMAVAILAEYFDQSIRRREDVRLLGVEIMGSIPPE